MKIIVASVYFIIYIRTISCIIFCCSSRRYGAVCLLTFLMMVSVFLAVVEFFN